MSYDVEAALEKQCRDCGVHPDNCIYALDRFFKGHDCNGPHPIQGGDEEEHY